MDTMEILMVMQPVADSLRNWGITGIVLGLLGILISYIAQGLHNGGKREEYPSPERYAELCDYREGENHPWTELIDQLTFRRLYRTSRAFFWVGIFLYAVSIGPAVSKEMFKNSIVYNAVTSDTTAHAVKTLDKLLDKIDAKLDGAGE